MQSEHVPTPFEIAESKDRRPLVRVVVRPPSGDGTAAEDAVTVEIEWVDLRGEPPS